MMKAVGLRGERMRLINWRLCIVVLCLTIISSQGQSPEAPPALAQSQTDPQGRPQPIQPASAPASVSIAGNLIMGKKDAPVTMIEFSDYQCPFCRRFFETTLPTLKAEYVETGKVPYS